MSITPEQLAREEIDRLLTLAGWVLQDKDQFDRNASEGVAVREFSLPNGECDYLLFVAGKAAGVIEAKKAGSTLSGVETQSEKYIAKLPEHLARWSDQLVFHYESTGAETYFCDRRDPKARSRALFAFQKPATLHAWLKDDQTLRGRLRQMPQLDVSGLRDCQIEAVKGLETSLALDNPRALIQDLAQRLTDPPYHLTTADVWQAYRRLESSLVRGTPADKVLTEIISLARFATGQAEILEPYAGRVTQRFNLWIGRQKNAGRTFTEDQMNWLEAIRDYLAVNVEIAPADLTRDNPFSSWGGVVAARQVFGPELNGLLDELSEALAA